MAVAPTPAMFDAAAEKLTFEIFSILENKFLFGGYDDPKLLSPVSPTAADAAAKVGANHSRVRILSIDGSGSTDGILAAASLLRLESSLRLKSGNPNAAVADYFDVVAGAGAGGILAALLFTKGKDGRPLFTAEGALKFLVQNRKRLNRSTSNRGVLRRVFGSANPAQKVLARTFGESTLKDTMKSVLIPCYDLSTRAAFLFSRADAVEMDGYDFKMSDVCLATSADPTVSGGPLELRSVDKRTKIVAVDGGIAMNNPTAAAITHVLHNKQEFPLCNGVEDLLVVSLGNGESDSGPDGIYKSTPARFVRIAGEGASDMVDQAVSMAFGECRRSNYVRIQGNGMMGKQTPKRGIKMADGGALVEATEEMLAQKNVESVLFKGKKMAVSTNVEKLEWVSGEVIKEHGKRKTSILPAVVLKQAGTPRTSSATTLSSLSSNC